MQTIGSPILCQNQDVQDGWIVRIPARLAACIILPTNPTLQSCKSLNSHTPDADDLLSAPHPPNGCLNFPLKASNLIARPVEHLLIALYLRYDLPLHFQRRQR